MTRDFSIKEAGLPVGVRGWELGPERSRDQIFFGVAEARAGAVSFLRGAVKDDPLRFCVVSCKFLFCFFKPA